MSPLRRLRRTALPVCLLGLLAGCGHRAAQRPPKVVRDLIADLDLAEIQREPGVVDLGTPEARPLLRQGWSTDEGDPAHNFVWSNEPESEIAFFLAAARDVPLILKGSPYPASGAPAQGVTLVLNGSEVGRVTISGEEAKTVLPERALRAGENRLVLRYAWTRSPFEESGGKSDDHRRLAVAWDRLRFETGADEQGRVRGAGGQLALPFGRRLDSFQRLPPGSALVMDDLRSPGGQPGELRVSVQPEGGPEREVGRLQPGSGPVVLALGDAGTGPARLSLTALSGKQGGSGLVLWRPAIAAPHGAKVPAEIPSTVAPAAFQRTTGPRPRNVILYLVDTLRADHLGCYGYSRPVSPHIDAFARQAVTFRHTVAQSSWTRPATTTILTGLLPRTHGVNGRRDKLSEQALTLAEMLQARGYQTAGFVTNGNVARSFGLAQGFETYELLPGKHSAATDVNAAAAGWLESEWKKDAPFFLYLHTVEPHAPYTPPAPFRERFAPEVHDELLTRMRVFHRLEDGSLAPTPELRQSLLDLYDAEIAANDAAFGDLIDLLARRGLWEDTVVVFISDHGEELFEHGGWEHGKTLHGEVLDVPLIVRAPGAAARTVQRQVQQVDVAPTVLNLLGLPIPPVVEGHSLLPWMTGTAPGDDPDAEAYSWLDQHGFRAASVTTPAWRMIEDRAPNASRSLYDRKADPGEHRDLADGRAVRTGYLRAHLLAAERRRKGALQAGTAVLDEELRKELQALGYLR
ncbi:MAG TPA: sulfatase [Thermoanaerobaculia bacterium]